MLLTIDIGNTNVTLGLFRGEELGPRWRLATEHERMPDEYGLQILGLLDHAGLSPQDLTGVCLASVVPPLTGKVTEACRVYLGYDPLVVDAGVKTGVRIRYEDPRAVGADRVADAAAVQKLYGTPACVVDFGTAMTFDVVNSKGDYLGGVIAPGMDISSMALSEKTALLPLIKIRKPLRVVGKNTVESIEAGIYYGFMGMVKEIIERIKRETGIAPVIIATGGYAGFMAKELPLFDRVHTGLVLEGMRLIWEENMGT